MSQIEGAGKSSLAEKQTDEYETGALRYVSFFGCFDDLEPNTVWSTTHGFWIAMGGFHQFNGDIPTVFLTSTDVLVLIADGLLIPPTEAEIRDRSKGDTFSKLIVLVQSLWFMTQCIARHIEHLPITELEIATVAYTIPILGIYICWWSKPLAVSQPIRIPYPFLKLGADRQKSWIDRVDDAMFGEFTTV